MASFQAAHKIHDGWLFVAEDPQSGELVLSSRERGGLWRLDAAGDLRAWAEAPVPYHWASWTIDENRVVAIVETGDGFAIEALDRNLGRRRLLARVDVRPTAQGLAMHGDRVWFSVLRELRRDLLLVEGLRGSGRTPATL